MERRKPYVGVSGVASVEQQKKIIEIASDVGLKEKRILALGIKAVHKTQYLDIENKYGPSWYPVGDRICDSVSPELDGTYNVAQVYMEPNEIAQSPEYALAFIDKLMKRGRTAIHAVQFDMLPYDKEIGLNYRNFFKYIKFGFDKDIILQCHKRAIAEGPTRAIETIECLSDDLDYVLFDASLGQGIDMNPDNLMRFCARAYRSKILAERGINIGVAGGLDGGTVREVMPRILAEFPDISWDAEGKLHQGTDDKSLNIETVEDYLRASAGVL